MSWLDEINWNADGLVPAIAQDHRTGRILMMAWMNREALALTVEQQRAIYWSRSRGKLWRKGEESGHVQRLHELRLDCDATWSSCWSSRSAASPATPGARAASTASTRMAAGRPSSRS